MELQEIVNRSISERYTYPDIFTEMKILLTNYNPENDNNILRENIIKYKDKIKIRINKDQSIKKGDESIYFCIGDNRMYRLEYDTEVRKAICNFNDIYQIYSISYDRI